MIQTRVVAGLMSLLLCLPLLAAENLAPGADFETAFESLPEGWGFFENEGGQYVTGREAEAGPNGAALRVAGTGDYGGAFCARTALDDAKSLLAGGMVTFEGQGQATIKLDFAHGQDYVGSAFGGFVKAGEGWRAVRVDDHRVDFPTADHVLLAVAIEGTGTALFDNVYLEAVDRFVHDADNLASYGTTERGVGTTALGWELFHPEGSPPAVAGSTPTAAHTGRAGLRLAKATEYAVYAHDPVELDRTMKYVLTGWVRCRTGRATIKIDFKQGDEWLGQQPADYAPADGQWRELRVEVDPGLYPNATEIAAAVAIEGADADADFDDLVLAAEKG